MVGPEVALRIDKRILSQRVECPATPLAVPHRALIPDYETDISRCLFLSIFTI
jgi:hypothetical protein